MRTFTKVEEFKPQEYQALFSPLINVGIISGFLNLNTDPRKHHGRFKRVFHWIFVISVHAVLWSTPARLMLVLFNDIGLILLPILSSVAYFICLAYGSTLSSFSISKNFSKFCQALDKHTEKFGSLQKEAWTKRYVPIMCRRFYIGLGPFFILCFFSCVYFKHQLQVFITPFKLGIWWQELIFFSYLLVNLLTTFSMSFTLFLFIMLTWYLFISEFTYLERKLTKVIGNPEILNNGEIEKIRQEFISLVNCLNLSNSLFCHYLFAFTSVLIPVVCFWLYGVIRTDMSTGEMGTVTVFMCIILISTFLLVILGAILNLKAHSPINVLNKVDLLKASEQTVRAVTLFTSRLSGPSIGYSVYGLFTMNTETILTIFGTLVTYTIVMLQFADTASINTGSSNITCHLNITAG